MDTPDATIRDWIGHSRSVTDTLTARLAAEYRATMGPMLCKGPDIPGLQWILAPRSIRPRIWAATPIPGWGCSCLISACPAACGRGLDHLARRHPRKRNGTP